MRYDELKTYYAWYHMKYMRDEKDEIYGVYLETNGRDERLEKMVTEARTGKDKNVIPEVEETNDGFVYRFYAPRDWFGSVGFGVPDELKTKIGKAIDESPLSKYAISEMTGIPLRTLTSWQRNERRPPDWEERLVVEEIKRLPARIKAQEILEKEES